MTLKARRLVPRAGSVCWDDGFRQVPDVARRPPSALREVWNDPSIEEISAEDLAGDYPTVRYGPPGEAFVVDLISRLGEAFDYDDLEAELVVLDGVTVRVATPRTLYEMKKGTVRLIDRADATNLRDKFDIKDEE